MYRIPSRNVSFFLTSQGGLKARVITWHARLWPCKYYAVRWYKILWKMTTLNIRLPLLLIVVLLFLFLEQKVFLFINFYQKTQIIFAMIIITYLQQLCLHFYCELIDVKRTYIIYLSDVSIEILSYLIIYYFKTYVALIVILQESYKIIPILAWKKTL